MGGTLYRVTSRSCSRCRTGRRRENTLSGLRAGPRGPAGGFQGSARPLRSTVCPVLTEPSPRARRLGSGLSLRPPSARWVRTYTAVGGSGPASSLLLPVLVLSSAFPPGQR